MRIAFLGNHAISYSTETHHAKSLEALGHEVIRLQEPKVPAVQVEAEALKSDLFIWTHTHGWDTDGLGPVVERIKAKGIPVVAFHLDLYMGIKRWTQYEQSPYMRSLTHFFTVDQLMADWLNANTSVAGHYLPPGVFGAECYISDQPSPIGNDVVFAGSYGYHEEWAYRPQLIDWLKQTYGARFTHVGGGSKIGTVRGDELNRFYANSKVVVGDTLCMGFDYPHYWSDRCPETLGRGGFLIHPFIRGMNAYYKDQEHLAYYQYGDFTQLKSLIDHYLTNDAEREAIRRQGHEYVKNNETYVHKWQTILETVFSG